MNSLVIMVVWQTKESHVHDGTRLALNNHSNAIKVTDIYFYYKYFWGFSKNVRLLKQHTLLVADHEAPSYCSKHQMARDKVRIILSNYVSADYIFSK